MANWRYILDISDIWGEAKEKGDDLSSEELEQLAGTIAERLKALPPYEEEDADLVYLVDEFEFFGGDLEDFDYLMGDLYDWGDTTVGEGWPTPRMCAIKTFGRPSPESPLESPPYEPLIEEEE